MKFNLITQVLGFTCIASNLSFAQTETLGVKARNGNIVMIDILEENPAELSVLCFELPIWHLAGSKINTSLLDLRTNLFYAGKGKLNGEISYKYGLGDQVFPETFENLEYVYQPMVFSVNKVPHSQDISLLGTYFFKEAVEPVEERIRLKTEGNVVTVTDVKTKQLTRTGFNLGYSQGFTWYNMNNMSLNVSPIGFEDQMREVQFQSMSTVQEYKFIKLGISRTKAVNLKLNAEGYGERESSHISISNFNLICAVQNKFDDVYVGEPNTSTNLLEVAKHTIDDGNKKLPIGFEFTHREIYKKSFFSFEYGVKYLPGMLKNINLMVTLGISVSFDFLRKN